ncbi:MAG: class I SAM-dependent methyltransferase [Acidimicrobiia bacterium]|nr:class I SAM-dependent methyltransferase [Acidimicrobiia bacterium]MYB73638.1 class I SAM-dependent methyltransferase [Acidimicrobiia bacterium]MYH98208.1 class I SAM-dependent methyltransferase [Acidimicrobiia bacterium]
MGRPGRNPPPARRLSGHSRGAAPLPRPRRPVAVGLRTDRQLGSRGVRRESEESILDSQQTYYRARADEYDEWWERRGRYAQDPEANDQWRQEISELRELFDSLSLDGDVIELAPGTGYWTELLAERARSVTAIDGAPEMIACNRARLGRKAEVVTYLQQDIFDWVPPRRFDAMVFCFWISHVPRRRLPKFLATCRAALNTGAHLFFVDNLREQPGFSVDEVRSDSRSELTQRRLNDGREFTIVKNFYDPEELRDAALSAEIQLEVGHTSTYFQYGIGQAI